MKQKLYFLFAVMLFACDTPQQDKDPWLPMGFEYSYSISRFDADPGKGKFRSKEYYDSTGKILLNVGPEEGCLKFFYDSTGRMVEKQWGRNCLGGIRDSMVYDIKGNLIGSVTPKDSLNPSPKPFQQTKFYDSENRLIKELIRNYTDANGNLLEYWRSLSYEDGRIKREVITRNEALEWDCTYNYSTDGRLISLIRKRLHITKEEIYVYDTHGRLIEKCISSNEYPLTPKVLFSASNNRTLYEYDANGFLAKETVVSHRGEKEIIKQSIKENNN